MARKKQQGNGSGTIYARKSKDGKIISYRGSLETASRRVPAIVACLPEVTSTQGQIDRPKPQHCVGFACRQCPEHLEDRLFLFTVLPRRGLSRKLTSGDRFS